MGRKRRPEIEPPENHERYIITYADLITLLLALFIIMYSMASVDSAKYQAISNELSIAFGSGESLTDSNKGIIDNFNQSDSADSFSGTEQNQIDTLEKKLVELINEYDLQEYIIVSEKEKGLSIDIKNEFTNIALFASGSAKLNPEANEIISKIGGLLRKLPAHYIRVEGHTDNIPISSGGYFESNWELSTARATNVVKLLINESKLDPSKLSAVGHGEFKPIANNSTYDGRAKNRRVNIVILKSKYSVLEQN